MTKQNLLAKIHEAGIVPVVRTVSAEFVSPITDALIQGGIAFAEVTLTIPDAFQEIKKLSAVHGERLVLGTGTVLDVESAKKSHDAGAQFVVTPCLRIDVIEYCRKIDLPVFAGSLTPTEIHTAWSAGADLIKVFPCSAMGGADYLKSVKGPFPGIELMPTGGVNINTAASYLKAGAFALGVGTDLAPASIKDDSDIEAIVETAKEYRAIVAEFRNL